MLWAELGDDSSESATVVFEPGGAHEVELRLLLARVRPGRLIGRVYDAQTDNPGGGGHGGGIRHGEWPPAGDREQSARSVHPQRCAARGAGTGGATHRLLAAPPSDHGEPGPHDGSGYRSGSGASGEEPIIATVTRLRRLEVMGFSDRPCKMRTFLDGIELRGFPVAVLMIEVAGVEVYKGPASLPAEFAGSDARCGAVVIWTK